MSFRKRDKKVREPIVYHDDTRYYEGSYVTSLQKKMQKLEEEKAYLLQTIKIAYEYLKNTYDLPTWKDEPEYAMMKDFEETIEKILTKI